MNSRKYILIIFIVLIFIFISCIIGMAETTVRTSTDPYENAIPPPAFPQNIKVVKDLSSSLSNDEINDIIKRTNYFPIALGFTWIYSVEEQLPNVGIRKGEMIIKYVKKKDIGGKSYIVQNISLSKNLGGKSISYIARKSDDGIYLYNEKTSDEIKIYNLPLKIGDVFEYYNDGILNVNKVMAIQDIIYDGKSYNNCLKISRTTTVNNWMTEYYYFAPNIGRVYIDAVHKSGSTIRRYELKKWNLKNK